MGYCGASAVSHPLPRWAGPPSAPALEPCSVRLEEKSGSFGLTEDPRPRQSVSQEPGAMAQGRLAYHLQGQR